MDFSRLLEGKSRVDLEKIRDDEDKINCLVMEAEPIQHLCMEKEIILSANRNMAEGNLQLKPRLEASRQELIDLNNKLASQQQECEAKKAMLESRRSTYSTESAIAILQAAAAEAEQESEVIADGFVREEIDIRDFLKQFLAARTKSYDLKHKSENMEKLITAGGSRRNRPAPPAPSAIQPPGYQYAYPPPPQDVQASQFGPGGGYPNQQAQSTAPYPPASGSSFPAYPPSTARNFWNGN